jgi:type II secretory pathway predicted ATPase ExeA
MQPDQGLGVERSRPRAGDSARLAVSSRRGALERLSAAVRDGRNGPVLLTGEPGAGKTWLADRLEDGLPAGWRALSVELTSVLDALEFLRLVADALGLPMTDRLGSVRLRIRAALEDDSTEGRKWLLRIDEAHRGSPAVWEELDLLASSLGRPSGFGAMLVMGRTELVRELTTRRHEGWAIRLGLHVHLMPLDLDEARELLAFHGRDGIATEPVLEEIHRDALGNPRMLLRLAAESRARAERAGTRAVHPLARGGRAEPPDAQRHPADRAPLPIERPAATSGPAMPADDRKPARSPALIPSRPPIRLEDGLVEVGWDGDLEDEPTDALSTPTSRGASISAEPDRDEELVDDHYAALQAWTEWTRNRERSTGVEPSPAGALARSPDFEDRDESRLDESSAEAGSASGTSAATVRAETSHDYAPYSQLFTRLRQSHQG